MKKPISEMTTEECNDELVFNLLKNLLNRAREAQIKADAAFRSVMQVLDDMCIEPDHVPSNAENADNLEQAITCYIAYGEYSVAEIMREVKEAYGKERE